MIGQIRTAAAKSRRTIAVSKTFSREQRKNNKYTRRKEQRVMKMHEFEIEKNETKDQRYKKKWRPHSEIEID